MNSREKEIRKSRRLLSDERLSAFIKAVKNDTGILAVKLINNLLDSGQTHDEIFYTGSINSGFILNVQRISDNEFIIEFGCSAGYLAGDGGRWKVIYNGDEVKSAAAESQWIS